MSRRHPLLILALVCASSSASVAQNPREITWLEMEFPPFFIEAGRDGEKGIADQVVEVLRGRMTQWRHSTEVASTAQITMRLRAGDQVCSPAYIKTPEREQFMEFSLPDLLLPPNGITIRRVDLERFGGGGPVSLAALLDNPSLRLGVAGGRSYGEEIDTILQGHKQDRHVYVRFGEDIYASLFDLLARKGVDYIVGYPYEAAFHARQKGLEDSIVSLPVRENPSMTRAHVACPKTDWGRSTIATIDAVLREVRPTAEYRAFVEQWLGPELVESYRTAYDAEFGAPR